MVGSETGGLVWEGSSFTAVISGAPSASLTESGTSAFPRLRALLGSLPVIGLRDRAVLVVRVSTSVLSPVSLPQFLAVVVRLPVGGDSGVAETNSRWGPS